MRRTTVFVGLAGGLLAGCHSPHVAANPGAPSPPSVPVYTIGPATWHLQSTVRSISAPDDCFTHPFYSQTGISAPGYVDVVVAADTYLVFYAGDSFEPDFSYSGQLRDGAFTVMSTTSEPSEYAPSCADGSSTGPVTDTGTLTGTFSPDLEHFTATEVKRFHTTSGDISVTSDWVGDAP